MANLSYSEKIEIIENLRKATRDLNQLEINGIIDTDILDFNAVKQITDYLSNIIDNRRAPCRFCRGTGFLVGVGTYQEECNNCDVV